MKPLRLALAALAITVLTTTGAHAASCGNTSAGFGPWLERFKREIKATAKLQHPRVVALYDSGDAGGLLYYVMPFVDGESLRDRLNNAQALSFASTRTPLSMSVASISAISIAF